MLGLVRGLVVGLVDSGSQLHWDRARKKKQQQQQQPWHRPFSEAEQGVPTTQMSRERL